MPLRRARLLLIVGSIGSLSAASCGNNDPVMEARSSGVTINSWQFVGPNGYIAQPSHPNSTYSGTVLDVEQVPNTYVYRLASSLGGVYEYSTTPTSHWFRITDTLWPSGTVASSGQGLAFSSVSTKPSNTSLILVGTGDYGSNAPSGYVLSGSGIWRTTDSGATWANVLTAASTGSVVYRMAWAPGSASTTVYAATAGGCWKSSSDGAAGTWTQVYASGVTDVVFTQSKITTVYLGVPGVGVVRSTNGGGSWVTSLSRTSVGRTVLSVGSTTGKVVYAGSDDPSATNRLGLFRTSNEGVSWTGPISFGTTGQFGQCDRDIAVGTNGNVIIAGCNGVMRSADGGNTWADISTGNVEFFGDVHAIRFTDNVGTVMVGDDHGYHWSSDYGATFHSNSDNIPIDNLMGFDVSNTNPKVYWVADWDSSVHASFDGGATWRGWFNEPIEPDTTDVIVDPANGSRAIAMQNRHLTTDGGVSWSLSSTGLPATAGWARVEPDQVAPVFLYTQAGNGIYQSTNFGTSWVKYPSASVPDFPNPVFDMRVGRWASGGSVVYMLFAAGPIKQALFDPMVSDSTWVDLTTGHGLPVLVGAPSVGFAPSISDAATAYAFRGNNVYVTHDRGQSWSDATGDMPAGTNIMDVAGNSTNSSILYAASWTGVYKTINSGTNWRPWINGLPRGGPMVTQLKAKDFGPSNGGFQVLAGIWGLGIWTRDGSGDDP
jgi:hypothetical protein